MLSVSFGQKISRQLKSLSLRRTSAAAFSTATPDIDPHDFYTQIGAKSYETSFKADAYNKTQRSSSGQQQQLKKSLSPSYFTGRPIIHDTIYELDFYLRKYSNEIQRAPLVNALGQTIKYPRWASDKQLSATWQTKIASEEYQEIISKLNSLALAQRVVSDARLNEMLEDFRAVDAKLEEAVTHTLLDDKGRGYAVGYRRRVCAHVWLTEAKNHGEGKVFIDGKDFVDYFERFCHREAVILPYEVTDTLGKYNAWCTIETSVPNAKGDQGKLLCAVKQETDY